MHCEMGMEMLQCPCTNDLLKVDENGETYCSVCGTRFPELGR